MLHSTGRPWLLSRLLLLILLLRVVLVAAAVLLLVACEGAMQVGPFSQQRHQQWQPKAGKAL
jgi:outer membrane biogenesis lipoprotein LolB